MASRIHPNRLARKLIKALIAFSAVLTLVITAVQLWIEFDRDVAAIDDRFRQLERSYIGPVAETVWRADVRGLNLLLKGLIEFPDFKHAVVEENDGTVVARIGDAPQGETTRRSYDLIYRFRGEPQQIGTLHVEASLAGVYQRLWDRVWVLLLSNGLKTVLVAAFMFVLVYWLLTRHLETMARFARGLTFEEACDDLALHRGPWTGPRDEIDDLAHALNEMKSKLSESYADVHQLSDELEVRVRGRTRQLVREAARHKHTAIKLAQSEARLRDIASAGSDWIWEMGPDLRFTYHSMGESAQDVFKGRDIVGKTRMDLADDLDDREKWDAHQADLNAHRPFRDFKYRQRTPDGHEMHVRVSGKPVFDAMGAFTGYRGLGTDITREVVAERRAAEAQERLHVLSSAIEQNPSAVFITDRDGIIEFVNDKFVSMTGYAPDEAIGQNPRILKSPATKPDVHAAIWHNITHGRVWRGELVDLRKDGSEFWAYATIAPVKDSDGEITHYIATHEDITARKEYERRLREATDRAEVANRTKSEIMANMSHELRTPLNAIIGFSDTMMNGVFGPLNNERYEDYVADIKDSGRHLLDLINDILDVSAIEAGKLTLRPEPLAVPRLVDGALKLVRHRADGARVTLDSHVESGLDTVVADPRRVKQVLLNLLSNAVKFTPEGGRVTLSAHKTTAGGVRFEVEDTGIGMDEAGIEIALTQFGQVDSDLSRRYEGTGLGLPLTKNLVELHGGTLDIRSRLGHGTTVVVRFPPRAVGADDHDGDPAEPDTLALAPDLTDADDDGPKTVH